LLKTTATREEIETPTKCAALRIIISSRDDYPLARHASRDAQLPMKTDRCFRRLIRRRERLGLKKKKKKKKKRIQYVEREVRDYENWNFRALFVEQSRSFSAQADVKRFCGARRFVDHCRKPYFKQTTHRGEPYAGGSDGAHIRDKSA
jgi:hypothetical protein